MDDGRDRLFRPAERLYVVDQTNHRLRGQAGPWAYPVKRIKPYNNGNGPMGPAGPPLEEFLEKFVN